MIIAKSVKTLEDHITSFGRMDFEDGDVRNFLIAARDFLPNGTLTQELANFVAHPLRDRGISHVEVDANYLKLRVARIFTTPPLELDVSRLSERLHRTLRFIVAQMSEDDAKAAASISKAEAVKLFDESYIRAHKGRGFVLSEFTDRETLMRVLGKAASTVTLRPVFELSDLLDDL